MLRQQLDHLSPEFSAVLFEQFSDPHARDRRRKRRQTKKNAGDTALPFEFPSSPRIAIVGAGISGLAAAYELAKNHRVTVFEAEKRLGGHARTIVAGRNGDQPVDTGFIVYNYSNYPNLTRMFEDLSVPVKKSSMSFSASIDDGAIEYGLKDFSALTAQSRNMVRPQFWRMIADIVKFNRGALAMATDPDMSLGEFLERMELGDWFQRYYLLPISGAIWSSTPEQMKDFPARSLIQFFENHALLSSKNHQWYTVEGGSIEYVRRMAGAIEAMGGDIRTNAPVQSVRSVDGRVQVRAFGADWETFDEVIMACHSDDALRLLDCPTCDQTSVLSAMKYQSNSAVLHHDAAVMPKRRRAWASWVFTADSDQPTPRIGITYWMNSLQGIRQDDPLFVTLNPSQEIADDKIYDQTEFRHPVFDGAAIKAQAELPAIQGQNNIWFAGAYTRHGFHEDGYASAMAVVDRLRIPAEAR